MTSRRSSVSYKILKCVGLGYDPELTFDPLARTTVRISPSLSKPFSTTEVKWDAHSRDTSSATAMEDKSKEVADFRVQALPSPAPSDTPIDLQIRNEKHVGELHVPKPSGPQTLPSSIPVPDAPKSRSLTSDSESTLNNLVPVPFIDYIGNTCPHVRHSNFSKPLLLPGCAIQEVAGFSGWFTKNIKTDLEWERIYFRVPETRVLGPDPGYGTISVDITPPRSKELPVTTPVIIYLGGILTPKEHHISRWQIDPLADPKGEFGYRVAFFNLRGQHGNPMTSARLFNPHVDDEDFAVAVSYLHTLYPEAPFIALAYSFGGPVIAKYMAQLGAKCPLHSAVFLAPCFDIARALDGFKAGNVTKGGSKYSAGAVMKMCNSVAEKFAASGYPIDLMPPPKGPHATDLYEVLMPYLGHIEYHEFSRSLIRCLEDGIPNIAVPALFIGSYSDSITGTFDVIHEAVKANPNFIRIMLHTKSHLGYYSGLLKPKRWAQKPIFEFIQAMADVPLEKDGKEGVVWDQYSDGKPIVYEALNEKDNKDAKPRQHGKRSDTIQA